MRTWLKRLSKRTDGLFKRRRSGEISRAAEVLLATLAERVGSGSVGLGAWDHDGSEETGYTLDPELLFSVAIERTESTGCTVSRIDGKIVGKTQSRGKSQTLFSGAVGSAGKQGQFAVGYQHLRHVQWQQHWQQRIIT